MNELENKGILLVIGIMVAVAIAGFVLVLFLNKDYQAALAEKPAELQSQQIQNPDVSAQENQKPPGKTESTIDACVDFDNGRNYYVSGVTTIESIHESRQDYCADKITLTEFYCNKEGGISQEAYFCSNGCSGGACLSPNQVTKCTDSDSGSNEYYVKGTIEGDGRILGSMYAGTIRKATDFCLQLKKETGYTFYPWEYDPTWNKDDILSNQNKYINCEKDCGIYEFYCGNNLTWAVSMQCPAGCKDGACVQESACTDSDGGQNYYVKGTALGFNGKNSDYCFDGNTKTLVELYCDGQGNVQNIYYDCPSGCQDGACIGQS